MKKVVLIGLIVLTLVSGCVQQFSVENNGVSKKPEISECVLNSDCDDGDVSTKDECLGQPKKCVNSLITECKSGDNYCPQNCYYPKDQECDLPGECQSEQDCIDFGLCSDALECTCHEGTCYTGFVGEVSSPFVDFSVVEKKFFAAGGVGPIIQACQVFGEGDSTGQTVSNSNEAFMILRDFWNKCFDETGHWLDYEHIEDCIPSGMDSEQAQQTGILEFGSIELENNTQIEAWTLYKNVAVDSEGKLYSCADVKPSCQSDSDCMNTIYCRTSSVCTCAEEKCTKGEAYHETWWCNETDGGHNIFVKGTNTVYVNSQVFDPIEDHCAGEMYLGEQVCDNRLHYVLEAFVLCENGCVDGACVD